MSRGLERRAAHAVLCGAVLTSGAQAVPAAARDTATADGAAAAPAWIATDVAAQAGLAEPLTRTWSAAPADHDGDGDQDVLVGYHPVEKLWSNQGDGTYERVADSTWPAGAIDRHNCAWADVDRNGLLDVMCSTGRGLRNRVKHGGIDNELWLQTVEQGFKEVGTEWGIGDPCGRGRDVTFLDANGDSFPDLFVGNQTPREVPDGCDGSSVLPNERSKLYVNQEGVRFVHAPELWPYGAGAGTRCVERLDFDQDGWDDLFACRAPGKTPRLYRNADGEGFVDVTARHGFGAAINDAHLYRGGRHRPPTVVTAGPGGFAHHRNVDGRFRRATIVYRPRRGVGMAVAAGDADGDGDRDLYAMVGDGTNGNPRDRILVKGRRSFSAVAVPGAAGAADDVVALRRFAGDRVEFLALNGHNLDGTGPVQLIRLVRG